MGLVALLKYIFRPFCKHEYVTINKTTIVYKAFTVKWVCKHCDKEIYKVSGINPNISHAQTNKKYTDHRDPRFINNGHLFDREDE